MKSYYSLALLALLAVSGCHKKKDPEPPQLEGGRWEYQGSEVTIYNMSGTVNDHWKTTPQPQNKFYTTYADGTTEEHSMTDDQLWLRAPYTRSGDVLVVRGNTVISPNEPDTKYSILELDEHHLKLRQVENFTGSNLVHWQSDQDYSR